MTAAVDPNAREAFIVERRVRLVDQYPFTFLELWEKVKNARPGVKQKQVHDALKECTMKGNPRYSSYNYRNKKEEKRGPGPATPVIYNQEAVDFLLQVLKRRHGSV